MAPSWAIVATVDEPAPLILAFVGHHLAQGAAEIHLFLDQPNPEAQAALAGLPQCRVTLCDKAHWAGSEQGRRPALHTRRQILNANLAYGRCTADWLLHCDADEFLRDGRAMGQELDRFGPEVEHLRLLVAERVMPEGAAQQGIFDGIFRLPVPRGIASPDEIYHPVTGFLDRGLTGHSNGKGLVRAGRGHILGIHAPKGEIAEQFIRSTRLLHFDGLTALHYKIKLLRRAYEKQTPGPTRHKQGRMTQFTAIRENLRDEGFCDALVAALKTLRPDQAEKLEALALLDRRAFAPELAGLIVDLSVTRFDADLAQRFAAFLAMAREGASAD